MAVITKLIRKKQSDLICFVTTLFHSCENDTTKCTCGQFNCRSRLISIDATLRKVSKTFKNVSRVAHARMHDKRHWVYLTEKILAHAKISRFQLYKS